MALAELAGVVLILGAAIFLAAAVAPVSMVFAAREAERKLELLARSPRQWLVTQWMFGAGTVVTAAGIGLLAAAHRAGLLWGATAGLLAGAALWADHLRRRASDPAAFARGEQGRGTFLAYSVLTQAGLAAAGAGLLGTALPPWVGWMLVAGAGASLALLVLLGDLPPFVYYVLTAIAGVVLWRGG